MRKTTLKSPILISTLAALIYSAPSFAETKVQPKENRFRDLLEYSGAARQIEAIPEMIRQSALQGRQSQEMPPKTRAILERSINESYRPSVFFDKIKSHGLAQLNDDDLTVLLDWYRSPLARKIADLETKATLTSGQSPEFQAFMQKLQKDSPDQKRLNLVKEIDQASASTESSINLTLGIFKAMATAMSPTLPKERQIKAEQLDQLVAKMRTQMSVAMTEQTKVGFLYTYRPLSDKELKQYRDHLRTPSAQKFTRVLNSAITEAFTEVSRRVGTQVGRALASQKKTKPKK